MSAHARTTANALERRLFLAAPAGPASRTRCLRWSAICGKSSRAIRLLADFREPAGPGMVVETGEEGHYRTDHTRTRLGLDPGLGNGGCHSTDVARAGALERISTPAVRYRWLSGGLG